MGHNEIIIVKPTTNAVGQQIVLNPFKAEYLILRGYHAPIAGGPAFEDGAENIEIPLLASILNPASIDLADFGFSSMGDRIKLYNELDWDKSVCRMGTTILKTSITFTDVLLLVKKPIKP